MSEEQTFTSACIFAPNLAHNFPTCVSANFSAQYRVALSLETGVIDRFILLTSLLSEGFLNKAKSSSVKSSDPSTSRFCGFLSHILIRFNLSLVAVGTYTGMPSTHLFLFFPLSFVLSHGQDRS